ncbi:MAG TPA: hypothetical protein VJN02_02200 [Gammaproteobacteria bacterium]|nr:hypothetical protein [Gammaproteobacteria bacterium]
MNKIGNCDERRYRIVPQMKLYDNIPMVLMPYVTAISKPNFISNIVNTDQYGYRLSTGENGTVSSETWWNLQNKGVVLGGSFVFGVGSSSDKTTLTSYLNKYSKKNFLNLGIRAGNSTQEFIASLPYLEESSFVILCSGANNLMISLLDGNYKELYAHLSVMDAVKKLSDYSYAQLVHSIKNPFSNIGKYQLPYFILKSIKDEIKRRLLSKFGTQNNTKEVLTRENIEKSVEASLSYQRRDLSFLKKIRGARPLFFVVQPFADSIYKKMTHEENELFEILDSMQGSVWEFYKKYFIECWPNYISRLSSICQQLNIPFLDLNMVPYSGWSYVDRVHMTDLGYKQVAERILHLLN